MRDPKLCRRRICLFTDPTRREVAGIRIIEFSDQFHFYVQSNASTHVGGPHLPNLVCVFHRILKFGILEMPRRISLGLLFQIFPKSRFEIHAGLIGQANQDKKYIGQFVSNRLRFLTLFEALFPVNTGNQSATSPTSSTSWARLVSSEKYRTPSLCIQSSTSFWHSCSEIDWFSRFKSLSRLSILRVE